MDEQPIKLEKGIFILSLDTELAWGSHGEEKYMQYYRKERQVINELLSLFEKYKIKATWAMVGHLFLDSCRPINGVKHPEIVRPKCGWLKGDWFDVDPISNIQKANEWYGKDIVYKILNCKARQEIGCHTFSHVVVDDKDCEPECLDSELKVCRNLAWQQGVGLKSFVFPKNMVAHLDVLKKNKFLCFRGENDNWYKNFPAKLKKAIHVFDNYLMLPTRAVSPEKQEGIWNLAGSYFYVHKDGWAKFLPISFRVAKSKSGIKKAVQQKKIFHLWFHPFNIASSPKKLLAGLEKIFSYVNLWREKGSLENLTMGETAEYLNSMNHSS
ncbi:MAG: hypothetical protein AUJ32_00405 [Parcubacteria group bacterium CG1_02_40_82]|uniref:NodB homology domain-containing protein n=4 Tax=Candidatus Portnoyibacteriota TaxID=1817913 RepID=A0A2M7IIL5_9BACT|nr:MAG: hypothetical protein AUJ32_00405 [Parcubacteria group bacterium CG1_02_40_82]PIQ75174.1 MAG: hypothetical protein COV84_02625 [Candidatus Portnoybacteria bacterium CG11_big_fil_rev_8_21_14_0_20_40_15]PIS31910.1 MAG: hypothetical protein COT41_00470 [Candidatus Portnoybacteria bacterium CG08_land_8_20_14_0_20_40_83]PIW76342.1 MAG: hypothetical protein CO001_01840 [Candidatus Portnoybacteria bacterium CG_4_8_14_3_um_filter_40_10]PIY75183.1 MAG: hypothetical protein COY85_01035 [Candidatus